MQTYTHSHILMYRMGLKQPNSARQITLFTILHTLYKIYMEIEWAKVQECRSERKRQQTNCRIKCLNASTTFSIWRIVFELAARFSFVVAIYQFYCPLKFTKRTGTECKGDWIVLQSPERDEERQVWTSKSYTIDNQLAQTIERKYNLHNGWYQCYFCFSSQLNAIVIHLKIGNVGACLHICNRVSCKRRPLLHFQGWITRNGWFNDLLTS